jgi:uncharacterized delta-60 repeat protein
LTAFAFGFAQSTVFAQSNVVGWGWNVYGATTVPAGLTNAVAIAGGTWHSLALRTDGTAVTWGGYLGDMSYGTVGLTNVAAIAAGGFHCLALRADGTVTAWGWNDYGQINVPAGLTSVVAMAGGGYHSLALRSEGTVVTWGANDSGQSNVPVGLTNVVAIAAGDSHSLALRADGTVVAWGENGDGQTSIPAGLTNVVAIAAGYYHSLALRADGTVAAWGWGDNGQIDVPVGLTNVVAIAGGGYHSLALCADGTVVAWGIVCSYVGSVYTCVPMTAPAGMTNVAAIAGGYQHCLALVGNGPPFVGTRLADRIGPRGGTVYFHANATGARTLNYQWQCNGTNIVGATNALLALRNVQPEQAGSYSVVIRNTWGSVTNCATLTVLPLLITTQPMNQVGGISGSVTFFVEAQTYAPATYQWRKDGVDIANGGRVSGVGSTGLTITNLQSSDAGNYTVVVTNTYGSVTSSVATLTITAGVLDSSFDLTGTVNSSVNALMVQPDGKLLGEHSYTFRLNSNGSTDTSFNRATNNGTGWCMARQSDGKVLIGGEFTKVNGIVRNFLARLNSDGTLDTSFPGPLPSGNSYPAPVACIAVQTNGQVLIGGTFTNISGVTCGNLARLNPNGTLDTSFLNGLAGTGNSGQVSAIVVQPDGKILVGGYFTSFNGTPRNMIARLNYDGTLDASFQNGLAGGYWSFYVSSLALKPDGKIVAGGYFRMSANSSSVAQLNANGSLDTSFQTSLDSSVNAVAVRSDGKVYFGGQFTTVNGITRNHIARLNANGTIDTGFLNGLSGATGTAHPQVNAIVLDAGKVYIGGQFTNVNGLPRYYLARLFDDLPVLVPAISTQPASREVPIGATVSFGVTSIGDGPLYYQWRKNGTNLTDAGKISGVATTNLTITSVQTNDAGNYTVVVTNTYGSATSSVAVLTVLLPLKIQANDASFGVRTNRFGFNLTGTDGQEVVIEACTNLANPNWLPLQTNTLGSGPLYFSDPNWMNYRGRFYRVRMQSQYQGIYTGQFSGQADAGGFAVMLRANQTGVTVGYNTPQEEGVYADGFTVAANGSTSYSTTEGGTFTGTFTATAVSGSFVNSFGVPGTISGIRRPDTGIQQTNAGYYVGTFSGYYSGTARAILAADGTLFLFTYAGVDSEGGGFGTVNAGNVVSASNVPDGLTITGTLNATTKVMSGNYLLGSTTLGTWTITRTESAY